ncbi:MAG TPA: Gfo/Idh/MocA family oxidoreductase [Planctomycetota bacterium]|nr:Gfo/Idh/MocA family oxidoreductase [Planctomycetota bacterium]
MAIKVAFIGSGGIAGYHLSHLVKIQDVQLVGFCDVQADRAKAKARQHKAKAYSDHRRMLDATKPDAVYVCTPPFAHGQFELDVVARGCHLFVEKPIATTMDTAIGVRDAVEKAGVVSAVGYQDRYQDIIAKLKALLRKRKVATAMGYWMGGMPGVAWWRVKAQSGGQHAEQTTHIFDMVRYLFGEARTVFAAASRGLMADVPNYDVEDLSAATLVLQSGLVATVYSACCLKAGGKVGMDIFCTDARIEYVERASVTVREASRTEEFRNVADYGQAIDEAFIGAIRTKGKENKVLSPYADACKSLALSLAVDRSLATGQPVEL